MSPAKNQLFMSMSDGSEVEVLHVNPSAGRLLYHSSTPTIFLRMVSNHELMLPIVVGMHNDSYPFLAPRSFPIVWDMGIFWDISTSAEPFHSYVTPYFLIPLAAFLSGEVAIGLLMKAFRHEHGVSYPGPDFLLLVFSCRLFHSTTSGSCP